MVGLLADYFVVSQGPVVLQSGQENWNKVIEILRQLIIFFEGVLQPFLMVRGVFPPYVAGCEESPQLP